VVADAAGRAPAIDRPVGVEPRDQQDLARGARLRHGTRADPVRGFAVGAKPTTAGESVDSPRIVGELPGAKTRAGRCSLP
jgi:hypothetical protein